MISSVAGATMVDARGLFNCQLLSLGSLLRLPYERRIITETTVMAVSFFEVGQFNGFSGSFGPSQSTRFSYEEGVSPALAVAT
jgi:hypothetical protein